MKRKQAEQQQRHFRQHTPGNKAEHGMQQQQLGGRNSVNFANNLIHKFFADCDKAVFILDLKLLIFLSQIRRNDENERKRPEDKQSFLGDSQPIK